MSGRDEQNAPFAILNRFEGEALPPFQLRRRLALAAGAALSAGLVLGLAALVSPQLTVIVGVIAGAWVVTLTYTGPRYITWKSDVILWATTVLSALIAVAVVRVTCASVTMFETLAAIGFLARQCGRLSLSGVAFASLSSLALVALLMWLYFRVAYVNAVGRRQYLRLRHKFSPPEDRPSRMLSVLLRNGQALLPAMAADVESGAFLFVEPVRVSPLEVDALTLHVEQACLAPSVTVATTRARVVKEGQDTLLALLGAKDWADVRDTLVWYTIIFWDDKVELRRVREAEGQKDKQSIQVLSSYALDAPLRTVVQDLLVDFASRRGLAAKTH